MFVLIGHLLVGRDLEPGLTRCATLGAAGSWTASKTFSWAGEWWMRMSTVFEGGFGFISDVGFWLISACLVCSPSLDPAVSHAPHRLSFHPPNHAHCFLSPFAVQQFVRLQATPPSFRLVAPTSRATDARTGATSGDRTSGARSGPAEAGPERCGLVLAPKLGD